MFYLILDILIYNYTNYLSYFFLLNINTKSLIYNISVGILIDYILNTFLFNTIFIVICYLLKN